MIFSIAVHFEFCQPFGEKDVKVPESDDSTVEVCVKLASTGCDDSLRCPVTIHLTFEDLSAEGKNLSPLPHFS